MLPFIQQTARDRVIVGLTEIEISNPYPVIEDLCDEYAVGKARAYLWNLVEIALMDESYNNPQNRIALLVWYRKMDKAIEATYVLMSILKDHPLPMA